ncbi:PAS domain-containing protein [Leptolyngbya sp. 'hensonii']|uniref:PAS domain-containing protein n=1 Tax=Leptolyngbya sp. 'hensonii' TaxID=1922337 RepID=UPI0009F988EA|nr:PAS domain-containing protein [Leptolyngbya sp. 'hensonii']
MNLPILDQIIDLNPLIVTPETSALEVVTALLQKKTLAQPPELGQFHQNHASCALVVSDRRLEGIFTERDGMRLAISGLDLATIPVSEVMGQPVITLPPAAARNVRNILSLMHQNSICHLPVVDDRGDLVGLIEQSRLYQTIEVLQQWLEAQAVQLKQTNSRLHREIAERQRVEMALQASEGKLHDVLNNAIAAITSFRVFANRDWEYEYFSAGCERLFGYSSQELMADKTLWMSRVHPEDWQQVIVPAFGQFFNGETVTLEYRFHHKDGSQRWITDTYTSRRDEGTACWIVTTVATDVTLRKQAEAAFQQQLVQEQLVAEIAQYIRQSLDLDEVLRRTVERVRQFLQTDRAVIFRFRSDWRGTIVTESVGPGWTSILSTLIHDPCFGERYAEPYRRGRISAITDLLVAEVQPCYRELLSHFQVRANLVVPILQGDELWGLLVAHHCASPREWHQEEMELLRQLATQVGIAIQQSELYQQTHRELLGRRRVQDALQESEERFRSLSASAPIGICQTNADGCCLYTNARWQAMSGLKPEDCMGNGWTQAIHPDDRETVITAWEAYLEQKQEFDREFRLLTPQGEVRWVSAHAAPMRSITGEIIGYVKTEEDITDRRRMEEALRESEALFRQVTENIHDIFWIATFPAHQMLYVSPAYESIWGRTCASLYEHPHSFLDAIHEEDKPGVIAWFENISQRVERDIEYRIIRPDGMLRWIWDRAFPVRDGEGKLYRIAGVSRDITEKKQLEAQFYRAKRMESLGTLASGIAHDLNNVFTPTLTIAQLLLMKLQNADDRTQELLRTLEESARRGAEMVKQILTFARGGAEGKHITLQIRHLLQDVLTIAQRTFPKSIEIHQDLPLQSLWLVLADPTQLHQVFLNLCVNARDAMPNGGVLTVTAENCHIDAADALLNLDARSGNYVMVTISDTGTGIPAELLDRIFDPFFTTKEPGKGTGLGLSIVLGIVKNQGGFLQVSSEVGQGTQFKVYLPSAEGITPTTTPEEVVSQGNGELILIVDDEARVLQTTQALLESCNFRTLIAEDGIKALSLYAQHQAEIAVVLLDIMMPNMDGLTAIRTLQQINSRVKIIASSGLDSNRQKVMAAGVKTFLSKPYTIQELLMAVQTLIAIDPQ